MPSKPTQVVIVGLCFLLGFTLGECYKLNKKADKLQNQVQFLEQARASVAQSYQNDHEHQTSLRQKLQSKFDLCESQLSDAKTEVSVQAHDAEQAHSEALDCQEQLAAKSKKKHRR